MISIARRGSGESSCYRVHYKFIFNIINSMGVQVEGERLVSTLLINNAVEVGSKINIHSFRIGLKYLVNKM